MHQQCLDCLKTYSNISVYITHLRGNRIESTVYVSAKQQPDYGFAINHDSILLPFFHEPHHDPFPHPSDNDSCDTEANSENASIDPEQPPVRIHFYGTLHLHNCLTGKPISDECFNIFDDEIDLWSPSAKNISVCTEWLRQSARGPSEPSETPQWRITPRPASIPRVVSHIALRSPFHRFFPLCRSSML